MSSKVLCKLDTAWVECLKQTKIVGLAGEQDARPVEDTLTVLAYVASDSPCIWRHPSREGGQTRLDSSRRGLGLPGGEAVAVLQAYRRWAGVPKRERPQLCQQLCLAHEHLSMIEEKILRLRMDLGIRATKGQYFHADEKLGTNNEAINEALVLLLLPCFYHRLCVHVLHSDRGVYMNIATGRPHRLHPDSCLFLGSSLPEFVLDLPSDRCSNREGGIIKLPLACTKSSVDDYISDRPDASSFVPRFDDRLPKVVTIAKVGTAVMAALIGSATDAINLRKLIARACKVHPDLIGVAADTNSKCIKISCPSDKCAEVDKLIGEKVASVKTTLESKIERINFPGPESGLRLLVGLGAKITELETTKSRDAIMVYVTLTRDTRAELHDRLTEACVRKHFERKVGELSEVQKSSGFPESAFWGVIKFAKLLDAFKAVAETNTSGGMYRLVPASDTNKPLYNLRFTMKRRTVDKRKICVHLASKGDFIRARYNRWYREPWYMSAEFLPDDLMVIFSFNGTLKTLGHIAQTFHRRLHITPVKVDYWHQAPYVSSAVDLRKTRDKIISVFTNDIEDYRRRLEPDVGPLDVVLDPPLPEDMVQKGRVITTSPTIAAFLYQSGYITFYIGRRELTFDDKPFTAYVMDTDLMTAIKDQVEEMGTSLGSAEVQIKFRTLMEGKECLEVFCSYPDVLRETAKDVQALLAGESLTGLTSGAIQMLQDNTDVLKSIMEDTRCKIDVLFDRKVVKIHGGVDRIKEAEKKIDQFIKSHFLDELCIIPLSGENVPRGLLQFMINKFGENLGGLANRYKGTIQLDYSKHAISCQGTREEQETLQEEVAKCKMELQENTDRIASEPEDGDEGPECAACLCPVADERLTLSMCGHIYCKECFSMQLMTAARSHEFPISCAKDHCGDLVLLDDIKKVTGTEGPMTYDNLCKSSVEAFLRRNRKRARPCPTPNCQMIYDVTADADEFQCPLCGTSICSHCHVKYHLGLSCDVVKVMEGINDKVKDWIKEKPQSRKVCPSCHSGVEKWIGCDNVRCIGCGVYMCWRCLKYFDTEAACYVHMDKKHRV